MKRMLSMVVIATALAAFPIDSAADDCVVLNEYSCCELVKANPNYQIILCGYSIPSKTCYINVIEDNQYGVVEPAVTAGWVPPIEIPVGSVPCDFYEPECLYDIQTGYYYCDWHDTEQRVWCIDEDLPGDLDPCTP